ncbi:M23 family metallopeptidase [Candidatus Peregrinibacteria bacterium]|nr:M23 family metallopeptidase [Candidatus Peregrinibacteria bacterium]
MTQLAVNMDARKARHARVFTASTSLRLPRLASLAGTLTEKTRVLGNALSPHSNRRKDGAPSSANAANSLFKKYTTAVALLFVVASVSPVDALYGDAFATIVDPGVDMSELDSALMTDQEGYIAKINPQTDSGDRSTMNDHLVHVVSSGETVSTIAASYNLKSSTVLWENGLTNANSIRVGQQLLIPPVDGLTHKVGKGENVEKIAKSYSVDAEAIKKQNRLVASNLTVGQEVFIPGAKPLETDVPTVRTTPTRISSSSRSNSTAGTKTGGAVLASSDDKPAGDKPFIFPTRGSITQGFHKGHYAYDIANTSKPPIWAAGAGTVTKATTGCGNVSYGCGGGYGNHVIIDHGNGLKTLYGHMEYLEVGVGDVVTQGQVVGKMGRTGNVRGRTGIHLHFEVIKNGVKQTPANYY